VTAQYDPEVVMFNLALRYRRGSGRGATQEWLSGYEGAIAARSET